MGGHGAHDEMQVPGRHRLAVHPREVIERIGPVTALVLTVGFLNLPVVNDVLVFAGGGVAVAEGELGLLRGAYRYCPASRRMTPCRKILSLKLRQPAMADSLYPSL